MPNIVIDEKNMDRIIAELAEPFDPKDVSFKPQTVNYSEGTAQAAAYADPRVYFDRLDKVVGPYNWGYEIINVTVSPYNKLIRGKKPYKDDPGTPDTFVEGNKVMLVAKVWINGLGTKSSTGDKDVSDENAITSAEAQAVKRAISQFGPGKYFYSLGHQSSSYDTKKKKWLVTPTLPDWAIPHILCEDCHKKIEGASFKRGNDTVTLSVADILKNSQTKYNANLCAPCQKAKHSAANPTPIPTTT